MTSWITIWDVRNAWGMWIALFITIVLVFFVLFVIYSFVRFDSTVSTPGRPQPTLKGVGASILAGSLLSTLTITIVIEGHRLRADLNSGHFLATEGFISAVSDETIGKSNDFYFSVGENWFKLPYQYARSCYPHINDAVRLLYEPFADLVHRGPDAHAVLKMQMTYKCEPIWG